MCAFAFACDVKSFVGVDKMWEWMSGPDRVEEVRAGQGWTG